MRLVFMGSPGVGKGTQAKLLCEALGLKHVSTGDLLREAVQQGTELGTEAGEYMERGDLVPDDIILRLIEETIERISTGFVLDGFPRTIIQAEGLNRLSDKKNMNLDGVILLVVEEGEIVRRMLGRGRADDDETTLRYRLQVYAEKTAPLIEFYMKCGKLSEINGMGSVEEIHDRIVAAVQAYAS